MLRQEIRKRIDEAIKMLYDRDGLLIENTTNERTVAAKLACYLTPMFDLPLSVDVEYNRQGVEFSEHVKDLPADLLKDCKKVKKAQKAGKKTVRVFPDIILHERGEIYSNNLLVIEIKRTHNKEPRDCDRGKLKAMIQRYRYEYALFLEFPSGIDASSQPPKQEWYERTGWASWHGPIDMNAI